ncbi:MAG: hypothetical protein FJZ61_02630 [Chlamydiae bacterium]|nr:hypothetical protein [Chlamydiota bacterium]
MCILVIDLSYQSGNIFTIDQTGKILEACASLDYPALPALAHNLVEKTQRELIAVSIPKGPGAFTPLRLAASIATALALAKKVPLITYPSFLGFLPETGISGRIHLDARSGLAYQSDFLIEEEEVFFSLPELVKIDLPFTQTANRNRLGFFIGSLYRKDAFTPLDTLKIDYVKEPR